MSDLIARLHRAVSGEYGHHAVAAVLREAADEIENLRGRLSRHANRVQEQEIERLRAELEQERSMRRPTEYRDHWREVAERRRTALEEIANLPSAECARDPFLGKSLAREALKGA